MSVVRSGVCRDDHTWLVVGVPSFPQTTKAGGRSDELPSLLLVRQVIFNLPNGQISLEAHEVELLRDAAAAQAGSSIAARDLSLLLERALHDPRTVAFRRAELHTLVEIAISADLGEIAGRLDGAAEASG
jgi:hypothetical protein